MIYFDNNATTQSSPKVVAAMIPYLTDCYSNASALTAAYVGADIPLRSAASAMCNLLNAEEAECFVFTSGATESNNWVFAKLVDRKTPGQIVISATEHPSIAEPAQALVKEGFEIVTIPVNSQGLVRMEELKNALNEQTRLVSIMAANNETGVLQPISEIGRLIRDKSPLAFFHTDATQAVGKIPIDLQGEWAWVDLLSFSAHKFHGPKGIGGLYFRPENEIEPLLLGGGQQGHLRAGTLNTPALAGLACAASEAANLNQEEIGNLRNEFEFLLQDKIPSVVIHSRGAPRLPNTSFFSLIGERGSDLAESLAIAGMVVGTGSACSDGAISASKTLLAMGIEHDVAIGGLRVSLSRFSTSLELAHLVVQLGQLVAPSSDVVSLI